jgi:hypothetical protein
MFPNLIAIAKHFMPQIPSHGFFVIRGVASRSDLW